MPNKTKQLSIASILFTLIIILWPVLALFSLPEGAGFNEQISSLKQSIQLHVINFIVAFLIAPSILFMLIQFYKIISGNVWNKTAKTAMILYVIYFMLVSISYGSQFIYLPLLLKVSTMDEILKWYFYNDQSLAILFNQTGYLFWSVATLLLFTRYVFQSKIQFLAIKILTLSALTQIVATIGFYFGKSSLASLSFYSGILLLPASIVILVYSVRKK